MKITKHILLALIGLGLVFATVVLEEKTAEAAKQESEKPVVLLEKATDTEFEQKNDTYSISSGNGSAVLQTHETSLLKFAPKSSAQIILKNAPEPQIEIELQSGRVWVNTENSERIVFLKVKDIAATSFPGVFDADLSATELKLASIRRGLSVEFFDNELILPEAREISIPFSKLDTQKNTIAKLRYSKLSKEFPFFAIDKNDDWIAKNKENDREFSDILRKKKINQIREIGIKSSSDLWNRVNMTLTFQSEKRAEKEVKIAQNFFDAAAYANLLGQDDEFQIKLKKFREFIELHRSNELLQKNVIVLLDQFLFAKPGEQFFQIKQALRELAQAPALAVSNSLNDILDIAASGGDAETKTKLLAELRRFGARLESSVSSAKNGKKIFFEYIRFDDFLRRNPELQSEEFLKISEVYEKAAESRLKDEEELQDFREFLIAEKLKKISVLSDSLEKSEIPYDEARRVILFVASQIDELKAELSGTAVLAYFESQLKEIAPLISFLRSESGEHMKGNFTENFKVFVAKKEEISRVQGLLRGSQGGTQISAFRREELAVIVSEDFGDAGIENVKIVLPDQENDPRVRVTSAALEGTNFTALYDTSRKVLSEIQIGKEKIPNSVRLDQLRKFILAKTGKLALPKGTTPESFAVAPSPKSLLETVAKQSLADELKKLGITIDEKYVGMEDFGSDVIHIRLAFLGEGSDAIIFSFDVSEKISLVSNLVVQTVLGEVPVNDEFALRELADRVKKVYELANLEQQKDEELERLLEEESL